MIVFDLKCPDSHRFEAWFKSSTAFAEQQRAGLVECPYCGSVEVSKAPMAPNVGTKGNQRVEAAPMVQHKDDARLGELASEAKKVFAKLKSHVEKNCDYVGDQFAEEARKIHYGESDERGIYGESTLEETQALLDEGIDVLPLPGNPSGREDA
ncbi:DUF1178 family protein [Kordiimonas sp.]|uniref:DUF1178 family protein n=1 Tax=Kordiimonas sp. TaxID=1970157 RepID=UPI003A9471C7